MVETLKTSRRSFLQGSMATGAVLVVGLRADGVMAVGDQAAALNPFVRILPDGSVQAVIKHFEMGQGTTTGLTTLVAEELDVDWNQVTPEFAPADNALYKNLFFGMQGTGGSTAMPNSYMQYRKAGAAARDVLIQAAAKTWGVAKSDVVIEDGILKSGSKSAHFGEMIKQAQALTPPKDPVVKDPSQFKFIGKDGLARKDSSGKITGKTIFAMDVKVPGMVYAAILRSPRFGGELVRFDATEAKEIPGFVDAKALPTKAGVVAFANSTWAAFQARNALKATWDFAKAENKSTDELAADLKNALNTPMFEAAKTGDRAKSEAAVAGAADVVEAEYLFPFLAHAPMEPLNCVIEPTEKGVRFHDGCQFPGGVQPTIAKVLGLDVKDVEIKTVYAGGSFGRRATPTSDYQVEAAMAYAVLGKKTPVKLVWSREDDVRGGRYRPMSAHRVRVGLRDGKIVGWDHRIATKPIIKGTFFESPVVKKTGVDFTSVEGINDTHYAIPTLSVGLSDVIYGVPVLWWRSVGHTHTAYTMETALDMVASALKRDPVELRLELLSGGDTHQKRLANVLTLAAKKANWGKPQDGRFQGIAVHRSFSTYVAEVVEISVDDGEVKVEKVTCAVDCGRAINPDVIRAQMEGGIGFALGAIMRNKITLTKGVVDQANFDSYEPLRITDMPLVDVHIVNSSENPTGVGEPAVPPCGPALANAIFAATGKRVVELPMSDSGIEFA